MNNLPGTDNAVSCDRELLAKGVAIVQRGVSSRSTLPILQGMLIETSDKGLHLIGTDLESYIETYVPSSLTGSFRMVLPAKYLGEIVRRLPEREVVLRYDSEKELPLFQAEKRYTRLIPWIRLSIHCSLKCLR